jgi:hypothetical protein
MVWLVKAKNLLEESAISRRIIAVDDHMCAKDHELAPLARLFSQAGSLIGPTVRGELESW